MLPVTTPRRSQRRRKRGLGLPLLGLISLAAASGFFLLVLLHTREQVAVTEAPSAFIRITDIDPDDKLAFEQLEEANTMQEEVHLPPVLPLDSFKYCDQHFGEGWLRGWNNSVHTVCAAPALAMHGSEMRCRSMADGHMPQSSAPQVMCDVTELMLDPERLHPAPCPQHRPHYMCGVRSYNKYDQGAFQVACSWPEPKLEDYPKDHLQDIISSIVEVSPDELNKADLVEETRTLLVTRESKEYSNVFHMLTDLFNTYLTLRMLGWDADTASPFRVVMLDSHAQGTLDGMWAGVAARGGVKALQHPWNSTSSTGRPLVTTARALEGRTRFRAAAFVPPGYGSLFFAHLYEAASCAQPTELFAQFRTWVLGALGLQPDALLLGQALVRVVYVSRQLTGKGRRRATRRVGNEDAIMAMLTRLPGAEAQKVDLAALPLLNQLRLLSTTDLIIGMHGAALAWTVLMPAHAGAVELWPDSSGVWRCYEHLSHWAGLLYRRWQPAPLDPGPEGKPRHPPAVTTVDVDALESILRPMVKEVAVRKRAAGTSL